MKTNGAATTPKKILIVDDHPMMREGIRGMIKGEPDLEICGEAENANQALELLLRHEVAVVLIENNTVATHLYRIAQEAVTNAVKHGKSKRIEIGLAQTSTRITVMVKDDGVGFSAKHPKKGGMGLRIMQYRARVIGATLNLQSAPGKGTQLTCLFSAVSRDDAAGAVQDQHRETDPVFL